MADSYIMCGKVLVYVHIIHNMSGSDENMSGSDGVMGINDLN